MQSWSGAKHWKWWRPPPLSLLLGLVARQVHGGASSAYPLRCPGLFSLLSNKYLSYLLSSMVLPMSLNLTSSPFLEAHVSCCFFIFYWLLVFYFAWVFFPKWSLKISLDNLWIIANLWDKLFLDRVSLWGPQDPPASASYVWDHGHILSHSTKHNFTPCLVLMWFDSWSPSVAHEEGRCSLVKFAKPSNLENMRPKFCQVPEDMTAKLCGHLIARPPPGSATLN